MVREVEPSNEFTGNLAGPTTLSNIIVKLHMVAHRDLTRKCQGAYSLKSSSTFPRGIYRGLSPPRVFSVYIREDKRHEMGQSSLSASNNLPFSSTSRVEIIRIAKVPNQGM